MVVSSFWKANYKAVKIQVSIPGTELVDFVTIQKLSDGKDGEQAVSIDRIDVFLRRKPITVYNSGKLGY